jgi:hypothetical protein
MPEYLYLLSNEFMPGLLKCGWTTRSPYVRAAELSNATGVPGRFKVERSWLLDDAAAAERRVHAAFSACRVSGEHFRMPVATAIARIEAMLPTLSTPQPAWRVWLERAAAVAMLILLCWRILRRLRRRLRAVFP